MSTALIFSENALLDECIRAANERGMYLISDGRRILASPVIPAGFRQVKITVKVRTPSQATMEAMPCAA
jgi:hypothetical protein